MSESMREEDAAEDYLMNLIDRSLVLVGNRRFDGRIKTCRLHDVLRDFCSRKAKEENFLLQIDKYDQTSFASSSCSVVCEAVRLSIRSCVYDHIALNPYIPHIHSFFCLASERAILPRSNASFVCHAFKLLKVLDMSSIQSIQFPSEVVQLVLLTFLALRAEDGCPPTSISNLQNLETLIILSRKNITIPKNIWKMVSLRHLYVKTGENNLADPCFEELADSEGHPTALGNLQTISQVCPSKSCMNVLVRTPNIRKLGLCGQLVSDSGNFWFPSLDFLCQLETLKLMDTKCDWSFPRNLQMVTFPPNLGRLTLSQTQLDWDVMSIIGKLPNLESLKLDSFACVGRVWKTSDGVFAQLKFLKFSFIDICMLDASSTHFPNLERLVFYGCKELVDIPSDLGNIATLQTVEVTWCSYGAEESAKQIEAEQRSLGNDELKILIYPSIEERKRLARKGDEAFTNWLFVGKYIKRKEMKELGSQQERGIVKSIINRGASSN